MSVLPPPNPRASGKEKTKTDNVPSCVFFIPTTAAHQAFHQALAKNTRAGQDQKVSADKSLLLRKSSEGSQLKNR